MAVRARSCTLTYAELNALANQIAYALLDRRAADSGESPVGVLFENGPAFVAASLGAVTLAAGRDQPASPVPDRCSSTTTRRRRQ